MTVLRVSGRRTGLTLMELVVVLSILAALAAIVIPMFPNLLRRAHKATDATQTSEISKAVQLYQASFLGYPDNFDLLTDGTSTTFPSYIPSDGGPFGNYVQAGTLTSDELAALRRVGITRVQKMCPTSAVATTSGFDPTRNPYAGTITTDAVDLTASGATSTQFAVLNPTAITNGLMQAEIASDPTAKYVVFGVGPRCSMVGKVIQDAPTSVPQNSSFTPATLYSRVGVIFKVSGAEVSRTERARFIAAVALEDDEIESTEKDIGGYYEVVRDTK